ncbi:HAD family hydrolase [Sandaracinus amylolyticus]|uniref:HAD family hydrolase n=1 Tax=Sandaracinus amylolyticus TaxID=927083 RepID=UPI001EFF92CD|nr:HAD-IB family phosphatase [Sandaracinus amylolyticus]UJR81045.1 Phosphoserine phosphatase [Sandaracinus amylolyticus]
MRTAAFFRLEGALSGSPAWAGAMWLASNAPSVRRRLFGIGGVAISAALAARDPAITRHVAWSTLRGFSEDRLVVLGDDYARDRVLPSIKPDARRLIDEARASGRTLVLISESIDAIVQPVADALGFEIVIANALEMDGAEATGVLREPVVGPEIDPKRLREIAARHQIDLARSCGYGASRSDGVLLSLVGLPCAVDPDRELARVARDLDWPVVRSVREEETR